MFAIERDHYWENAEAERDAMRALNEQRESDLRTELDLCRNALIIRCDGNREAVKDACSDALAARAKKKRWRY